MSDDRDIDDMDEWSAEEYAGFFTHLIKHAIANEDDAIINHIREIPPSPSNVMSLIMGLAHSLSMLARVTNGGHNPDQVHLTFAKAESADDLPAAVLIADGDDAAAAQLDSLAVDADQIPRPMRVASQIMSAAIAADSDTVVALALPVVEEFDDMLAEPEMPDPQRVDALHVVTFLAQSLAQYAQVVDVDALIERQVDALVEEIEAG